MKMKGNCMGYSKLVQAMASLLFDIMYQALEN